MRNNEIRPTIWPAADEATLVGIYPGNREAGRELCVTPECQ
jgi:hypothetical protein